MSQQQSQIQQFYVNKTLLITGCTGFVGKVLLEKVLRSLPGVKTIYVGITSKVGGGSNQEYGRFKKEVEDSQVFDRMKNEIGFKEFRNLVRDKIRPIALDLAKDGLGLTEVDREALIKDLNIIINCAGSTEFGNTLDSATRINVSGPLKLLQLAEECKHFECICHISTCYAICDHQGVFEEKLKHNPAYNWKNLYEQIQSMEKRDLEVHEQTIIGSFPNTYTFTKRMAEHLLAENNRKNIPMVIVRPSIIGASLEEPFPGWTDSITLAGGIYLIAGMGILRELPGDQNNIGDQVPVDIVVSQILMSVPMAVHQMKTQNEPLLINHASTSSVNPVVWREVLQYLLLYTYRSPFQARVFNPSFRFYQNK